MKSLFTGSKVIVEDEKLSSALYNKSCFGTLVNNKLELSIFEALYLLEKGKISICQRNKTLDYSEFSKKASKLDKKFLVKYKVYKNLRSRGYIVKTALKYGSDFRVYDKGVRPGTGHALFIVLAASEHDKFSWTQFSAMMRVSHSTNKKLLIAIVDDEGDVTFYTSTWAKL